MGWLQVYLLVYTKRSEEKKKKKLLTDKKTANFQQIGVKKVYNDDVELLYFHLME